MVTFRFYLVSVVAFFLALAVGVVVGSVLDEGISKGLQERLARVEKNLDDTVALVDGKNAEIDDLTEFANAVAPFAVEGRLSDTSTLVVSEPGMPNQAVEDTVGSLRNAGSSVEGIVWLERSWSLTSEEDRRRFEEIAGESGRSAEDLQRDVISAVLVEAGASAPTGEASGGGADGGAPTTVTTTTTSTAADVFASPLLAQLQEAGFVRLVPLGGAATGPRGAVLNVVAVTGTASRLEVPGAAAAAVAGSAAALGLPTVLAEVYAPADADGAERGELVARAGEVAEAPFSTVDDLDLVAGRVATVLALEQAADGVVGRYGYGRGVDGVLPRWPDR